VPDDINITNIKNKYVVGITSLDKMGNESDMILTKPFSLKESLANPPKGFRIITSKWQLLRSNNLKYLYLWRRF